MTGEKTELPKNAREVYHDVITVLNQSGLLFLIGGGIALKKHTGILRHTNDLDIFCKQSACIPILKLLSNHHFKPEFTDARWIAKAMKEDLTVDIIFNSVNNLCPVNDTWFEHAEYDELYDVPCRFIAPEELLWCKIFIHSRGHYDGADINHIILKKGHGMDWERILKRLENSWQLLLAQLLNFQFVYPSERDAIPKWVFDKLINLVTEQYDVPAPIEKVCKGPLIDQIQYSTDITEWGYKVITMSTI